MKRIIYGQEALLGPWMMKLLDGGPWLPGRGSIIGLWEDNLGPIAACLFEAHNGASVMMHCAAVPTKRWMNRAFLWKVFDYPFNELSVRKIISPVESSNTQSCRFIEHIGFHLEATLKDAAPKGDLKIYTMTLDQCRWLQIRDRTSGKTQSAEAA